MHWAATQHSTGPILTLEADSDRSFTFCIPYLPQNITMEWKNPDQLAFPNGQVDPSGGLPVPSEGS